MSLSIRLGNALYRNAFWLYDPLYSAFKKRQDAYELALLKKIVRRGNTVLDIGANIGFYAKVLSHLVGPEGKVVCFEPDADNYRRLVAKVSQLGNVTTYNKAVAATSGTIKLYGSPELNVDHRTYPPDKYEFVREIGSVSIDELFNGKRVDVIKMDIQGFEMQALQGMKETLEANPHITLISEFWPYGLRCAGSGTAEFIAALTALGFEIKLMRGQSLESIDVAMAGSMHNEDKKHFYNIIARRGRI